MRTLAPILLLVLASPAPLPSADRFPFAIPGLDATPGTAVDMSDLPWDPERARGPVRVEDGHLIDGRGKRLRLLGVNFSFGANFPDHETAEKIAAHLAKIGINAVRHHHMDARDIWRSKPDGTRELDPEKLERLSYLITQLSRNGIYSNINLHVSRSVLAAEGFPDADRLPSMSKFVLYIDAKMQSMLKDYARGLLGYTNPRTGRRLCDEPSIATIEITNENRFALAGVQQLGSLPERYREELRRRWNVWLKEAYGSTAKLAEAWGAGGEPPGPDVAAFGDFSSGAGPWTLSVRGGNRARLRTGLPGPAEGVPAAAVEIESSNGVLHELELVRSGLSIEEGKLYTASFWVRAEKPRSVYVDVSRDGDPWEPVGLRDEVEATGAWKEVVLPFRATATLGTKARWIFKLGDGDADVWIAAPRLRTGGELSRLAAGETVEAGTIPVPGRSLQTTVADDLRRFLEDVEKAFFADMYALLKDEIGVPGPVTGSQADWQALSAFEGLDLVDAHAYWEHPSFPGRSWDSRNWRIANTPMVRRPGRDALSRLAWHRAFGKPYTVSEYNHPAPSDWQVECVPLLCAMAAFQDWDAVYIYSYQHGDEGWTSDRIQSFFDINGNPAKIALLATGTMLYRRGDVSPGREAIDASKPSQRVLELGLALRHRVGTDLRSERIVSALRASDERSFTSDTGEVRWDATDPDRARFLVDTPRTKMAVGFIGGDAIELSGLRIRTGAVSRGFGAVSATSLDGEPLSRATRWLLTTIGNAENAGMEWNDDRTSVSDRWGSGPPLVEIVPVEVLLARDGAGPGSWKAYPLDPTGRRRDPVAVTGSGGAAIRLEASPRDGSPWYEVVRE